MSDRPAADARKATNLTWDSGQLPRSERWSRLGLRGGTLWFTGLSASGKSTIAAAAEVALVELGVHAYRLDGDNIRHGLNSNLGFSAEDRAENLRRVGEVARLFADAGVLVLASFISPYRVDRELVRELHAAAGLPFLEVFVDTPLEVCAARDPKGLYARARAGHIPFFTGVTDPYEAPETPELRLLGAEVSVDDAVVQVLALAREHGLLG